MSKKRKKTYTKQLKKYTDKKEGIEIKSDWKKKN